MVTSKNTIIRTCPPKPRPNPTHKLRRRIIALITVVAFIVTNCGLGYAYDNTSKLRQVNIRQSKAAADALGKALNSNMSAPPEEISAPAAGANTGGVKADAKGAKEAAAGLKTETKGQIPGLGILELIKRYKLFAVSFITAILACIYQPIFYNLRVLIPTFYLHEFMHGSWTVEKLDIPQWARIFVKRPLFTPIESLGHLINRVAHAVFPATIGRIGGETTRAIMSSSNFIDTFLSDAIDLTIGITMFRLALRQTRPFVKLSLLFVSVGYAMFHLQYLLNDIFGFGMVPHGAGDYAKTAELWGFMSPVVAKLMGGAFIFSLAFVISNLGRLVALPIKYAVSLKTGVRPGRGAAVKPVLLRLSLWMAVLVASLLVSSGKHADRLAAQVKVLPTEQLVSNLENQRNPTIRSFYYYELAEREKFGPLVDRFLKDSPDNRVDADLRLALGNHQKPASIYLSRYIEAYSGSLSVSQRVELFKLAANMPSEAAVPALIRVLNAERNLDAQYEEAKAIFIIGYSKPYVSMLRAKMRVFNRVIKNGSSPAIREDALKQKREADQDLRMFKEHEDFHRRTAGARKDSLSGVKARAAGVTPAPAAGANADEVKADARASGSRANLRLREEDISELLEGVRRAFGFESFVYEDSSDKNCEWGYTQDKKCYRIGPLVFIVVPEMRNLKPEDENFQQATADIIQGYKTVLRERLGDLYSINENNVIFIDSSCDVEGEPIDPHRAQIIAIMLTHADRIKDAIPFDCGAGTGLLSLVAIRLGAEQVVLIEKDRLRLKRADAMLRAQGCKPRTEKSGGYILWEADLEDQDDLMARLKALDLSKRKVVGLVNMGAWPQYGDANKKALEFLCRLDNLDMVINVAFYIGIERESPVYMQNQSAQYMTAAAFLRDRGLRVEIVYYANRNAGALIAIKESSAAAGANLRPVGEPMVITVNGERKTVEFAELMPGESGRRDVDTVRKILDFLLTNFSFSPPADEYIKALEMLEASQDIRIFTAAIDGALIGTASFRPLTPIYRAKLFNAIKEEISAKGVNAACGSDLAVDPDYRRNSIGPTLYAVMQDEAEKAGFTHFVDEVAVEYENTRTREDGARGVVWRRVSDVRETQSGGRTKMMALYMRNLAAQTTKGAAAVVAAGAVSAAGAGKQPSRTAPEEFVEFVRVHEGEQCWFMFMDVTLMALRSRSYGPKAGDFIKQKVLAVIQETLKEFGIINNIGGGDEIIGVLAGIDDEATMNSLSLKIEEALKNACEDRFGFIQLEGDVSEEDRERLRAEGCIVVDRPDTEGLPEFGRVDIAEVPFLFFEKKKGEKVEKAADRILKKSGLPNIKTGDKGREVFVPYVILAAVRLMPGDTPQKRIEDSRHEAEIQQRIVKDKIRKGKKEGPLFGVEVEQRKRARTKSETEARRRQEEQGRPFLTQDEAGGLNSPAVRAMAQRPGHELSRDFPCIPAEYPDDPAQGPFAQLIRIMQSNLDQGKRVQLIRLKQFITTDNDELMEVFRRAMEAKKRRDPLDVELDVFPFVVVNDGDYEKFKLGYKAGDNVILLDASHIIQESSRDFSNSFTIYLVRKAPDDFYLVVAGDKGISLPDKGSLKPVLERVRETISAITSKRVGFEVYFAGLMVNNDEVPIGNGAVAERMIGCLGTLAKGIPKVRSPKKTELTGNMLVAYEDNRDRWDYIVDYANIVEREESAIAYDNLRREQLDLEMAFERSGPPASAKAEGGAAGRLRGMLKLGYEEIPLYFKAASFRRISEIIASVPDGSPQQQALYADLAVGGLRILADNMRQFKDALRGLQDNFGGSLYDENAPLIDNLITEIESASQTEDILQHVRNILENLLTPAQEGAGFARIDASYFAVFGRVFAEFRDKITDENLQIILQEMFYAHLFSGWFCEHLHKIVVENKKLGIFEHVHSPDVPIRVFLTSSYCQRLPSMQLKISQDIPPALWCSEQILFVLNEFLKNVLVHTDDESPRLNIYMQNDYLVLEVVDRGPGISPQEAQKIMLVSYSSLPGADVRGGYGRGLATAKAYAEFYNGRFELESQEGVGTTARVILPLESLRAPTASAARAEGAKANLTGNAINNVYFGIPIEEVSAPKSRLMRLVNFLDSVRLGIEDCGDVLIYGGAVREEVFTRGRNVSDFDLMVRPILSDKEKQLLAEGRLKNPKKILRLKARHILEIFAKELGVSPQELALPASPAKFEGIQVGMSCYFDADGAPMRFVTGERHGFIDLSVSHAYLSVADRRIYDFSNGKAIADMNSRTARLEGFNNPSEISLSNILKAVRAIFQYDLVPAPETSQIIQDFFKRPINDTNLGTISNLPSRDREAAIYNYFSLILERANDPEKALKFLQEVDVNGILPELSPDIKTTIAAAEARVEGAQKDDTSPIEIKRVLVVDDEKHHYDLIKLGIGFYERSKGLKSGEIEVVWKTNSIDGLQALTDAEEPFDLVVSDNGLVTKVQPKGVIGEVFVRQIRQAHLRKQPVIILTTADLHRRETTDLYRKGIVDAVAQKDAPSGTGTHLPPHFSKFLNRVLNEVNARRAQQAAAVPAAGEANLTGTARAEGEAAAIAAAEGSSLEVLKQAGFTELADGILFKDDVLVRLAIGPNDREVLNGVYLRVNNKEKPHPLEYVMNKYASSIEKAIVRLWVSGLKPKRLLAGLFHKLLILSARFTEVVPKSGIFEIRWDTVSVLFVQTGEPSLFVEFEDAVYEYWRGAEVVEYEKNRWGDNNFHAKKGPFEYTIRILTSGFRGIQFKSWDASVEVDFPLTPSQGYVATDGLFNIGGVNPDVTIEELTGLTDLSIQEIESRAQPYRYNTSGFGDPSIVGFLGQNESFKERLLDDNKIVRELGYTHQELAAPLFYVVNIFTYTRGNDFDFTYKGQRYHVNVRRPRGGQASIFKDKLGGGANYTVTNIHTGESVRFSDLVTHYIWRYGFYEGNTSYRVDPRQIAKVFGPSISVSQRENIASAKGADEARAEGAAQTAEAKLAGNIGLFDGSLGYTAVTDPRQHIQDYMYLMSGVVSPFEIRRPELIVAKLSSLAKTYPRPWQGSIKSCFLVDKDHQTTFGLTGFIMSVDSDDAILAADSEDMSTPDLTGMSDDGVTRGNFSEKVRLHTGEPLPSWVKTDVKPARLILQGTKLLNEIVARGSALEIKGVFASLIRNPQLPEDVQLKIYRETIGFAAERGLPIIVFGYDRQGQYAFAEEALQEVTAACVKQAEHYSKEVVLYVGYEKKTFAPAAGANEVPQSPERPEIVSSREGNRQPAPSEVEGQSDVAAREARAEGAKAKLAGEPVEYRPEPGEKIDRGTGYNSLGVWMQQGPGEQFPNGTARKVFRSPESAQREFKGLVAMSFLSSFVQPVALYTDTIEMEYVPGLVVGGINSVTLQDVLDNDLVIPGRDFVAELKGLRKKIAEESKAREDMMEIIGREISGGRMLYGQVNELRERLSRLDIINGWVVYPQDLNPKNIIITKDGLRIIDPGSSVVSGAEIYLETTWNMYYSENGETIRKLARLKEAAGSAAAAAEARAEGVVAEVQPTTATAGEPLNSALYVVTNTDDAYTHLKSIIDEVKLEEGFIASEVEYIQVPQEMTLSQIVGLVKEVKSRPGKVKVLLHIANNDGLKNAIMQNMAGIDTKDVTDIQNPEVLKETIRSL